MSARAHRDKKSGVLKIVEDFQFNSFQSKADFNETLIVNVRWGPGKKTTTTTTTTTTTETLY